MGKWGDKEVTTEGKGGDGEEMRMGRWGDKDGALEGKGWDGGGERIWRRDGTGMIFFFDKGFRRIGKSITFAAANDTMHTAIYTL